MFDLADKHQKPVSEVFDYPAWEINYWQVYYSKEPSQAIRNEYLLSRLIDSFHHANFKDCKTKPSDFSFPDLWKTETEKSNEELVSQFSGVKGVKIHPAKK